MELAELLRNLVHPSDQIPPELKVDGLAYDSRRIRPNSVFVAIKGEKTNGNDYVPQAIKRGAVAIVSEDPCPEGCRVHWVKVGNARQALASLAAHFYGLPSKKLHLIGITGTNGKTSTAYLIESIVKASGARCGLISTIEYRGPEDTRVADRTTPESLDLQEMLADFVRKGCDFAVMEVSSHALAMERAYATQFRSAVFTNLTQDHLDFHVTMENYFEAKKKLFLGTGLLPPSTSVINHDDPYGIRLEKVCTGRYFTCSLKSPADFHCAQVQIDSQAMQLLVETPRGRLEVRSALLGKPNQSNILAALAVGCDLGFDDASLIHGIRSCSSIPGRFERIDQGQPFPVFVDYAHTPDALEKILMTARELKPSRVFVLFGCGGERDHGKRPQMARVAERLSDVCVVTSDNPRGEDPATILAEIEAGFEVDPPRYIIEPDRKKAIGTILSLAKAGDLVLIAGKGHETYQILPEGTVHFDDREEVRRALLEMGHPA